MSPRAQMDLANFLAGEVTPALGGRSDTEEYPSFLKTAENVFIEKHGGVQRRGGLQYVHNSSNNTKVRLVPFIYSRTDSYVMEFGDRIVSLYQNSDYVRNVGDVATYLGDGVTTDFQYPFHFEVENTQATAGQTVFSYTFTVTGGGEFGVLQNGVELTLGADYSHDSGAKTITLVAPATLDDIIQIYNADVKPEDIEVYLNGPPKLVEGVDYEIEPINTLANILSPFGTPAWDGDAENIGASWALPNDGTAISPADAQPILRESGISLTHGSIVESGVIIDSYTPTPLSITDSNTSIIPLIRNGAYIAIAQLNITVDDLFLTEVLASFAAHDASGNRASNFFWELRHNDTVLAQDTILGVNIPQTVNIPTTLLPPLKAGDVLSLQVRATPEHAQSEPQVNGVFSPTSIKADGLVNDDPWLHVASLDQGGGTGSGALKLNDITTPYTWIYTSGDNPVVDPQPIHVEFFTDKGAEVTLSSVYARNAVNGWVIKFNTPPSVGDTVLIRVPDDTPVDDDPPIFTFISPYAKEDLDQLYWAQANDIMFFCHEDQKPWVLTRHNHYDWRWTQPTLYGTPWDLPATSWQSDGSAVNYDFYFSADSKADMEVFFNSKLIAAGKWDLKDGSSYPVIDFGTITFTDAPPLGTTVLIASKESDYDTTLGYPRCVVFFQERLWFAATIGRPQTLWGSRVADFLDFAVKGNKQVLQPDDAVEYTIAAYTHESIEWLSSERVLIIGTSSTEHRLAPDEYISTDRLPKVSKMTSYGGSHQMPMYMGGLTCFIQQSGRQLRSFEQRSDVIMEEYESIELTWMASHMVRTLWIKEPYYALVPNNIAVMVREDGQLMTCMYDTSSGQMSANEVAWSRQITDGTFESVCVIPTDFGHQIWAAVKRQIEGVTRQYVELITEDFFMDSAGFSDGLSEITELTGLEHIEKKVVDVIVDGAVHPQRTVIDGKIELAFPGTNVVAGLPYRPKMVIMPFTDGNPGGTGQGKPGRWAEIWVRMIDSAYPLINGKRPPVRYPATPMGEPQPNFTGAVRVFDSGFSYDKEITVEQDLPLRFQVVNIYGTYQMGTG